MNASLLGIGASWPHHGLRTSDVSSSLVLSRLVCSVFGSFLGVAVAALTAQESFTPS